MCLTNSSRRLPCRLEQQSVRPSPMSPSAIAGNFCRTCGAAAFQIKHLERLTIDRRLPRFKLSYMSVSRSACRSRVQERWHRMANETLMDAITRHRNVRNEPGSKHWRANERLFLEQDRLVPAKQHAKIVVSTVEIAPIQVNARALQSLVADQSLGWSGGARG
jgi:hypothetical protein